MCVDGGRHLIPFLVRSFGRSCYDSQIEDETKEREKKRLFFVLFFLGIDLRATESFQSPGDQAVLSSVYVSVTIEKKERVG